MFTLSVVNHGQMKAATWVPIVMRGMSKVSTTMPWSVGRSSFTSWWALPAQPSARICPSSSYRPGSWRGRAHHHSTDTPTKVGQTSRVDKNWSWSVFSSLSEAGEAPCITSAGFQFLLLDTASQLWYFTLQYLKTAQVSVWHIESIQIY